MDFSLLFFYGDIRTSLLNRNYYRSVRINASAQARPSRHWGCGSQLVSFPDGGKDNACADAFILTDRQPAAVRGYMR